MEVKGFAKRLIEFVRAQYGTDSFIPLHSPRFGEAEKKKVIEALESGMVSSVGRHVADFEQSVADYTGSRYAVATVNGTAALHVALLLGGVRPDDEVITQSITFVATCNAIRYCGAHPILVDIDRDTLGMSPDSLEAFLEDNAKVGSDGQCRNRNTGRVIRACVPMHNFGHPVRIDRVVEISRKWCLRVIEDAAESLGSFIGDRHTGRFGDLATISFNGNKIVTTGGGGMIITDDEKLAQRARHLTTTAKKPHPYLYIHDELGYNYRLPAINAALGCAQMQRLAGYVESKRKLAARYAEWLAGTQYPFVQERDGTKANYWFNSFLVNSQAERDYILEYTNSNGVMTRPVWTPMHYLELYSGCQRTNMENSEWIEARLINVPSSVPRLDDNGDGPVHAV